MHFKTLFVVIKACYIRVFACIHNRKFTEFKPGTRAGVTVQQATVLTGDFEPNASVVVVVTTAVRNATWCNFVII